ncbi:MFS transporter [Cucumibacter marinus]|uniref:MFS transporter n=1 Tax=Cucumibacter marinus TaxID=1121252 RepID=UPI0004252CE7|nr:MFS transporter [Cucumibacter marinus]
MTTTELTVSGRPPADRRARLSWMFFDWAAQPFHTLILTFIFAPYFAAHVAPSPAEGQAMWGWAAGTGGLVIALLAPILGAVADASGPRKPFIAVFALLAIIGAVGLWIAAPGAGPGIITLTLIFLAIALFSSEFAGTFVNAMMPDLVPRSELGKLSGSGWALGYVGGIVALTIMLGLMSANPETGRTLLGLTPILGLDPATHEGDRAAGPLTAIWFLVFAIPLFLFVPDAPRRSGGGKAVRDGIARLFATVRSLPQNRSYFAFLISSMLYRDGLNALHAFGGIYAVGVLGLSIIEVGLFGILAAVAGAIGAFAGGRLDARIGPKPVVMTCCILLVIACLAVISSTETSILFAIPVGAESNAPLVLFYLAGALIGAAGGALQAASRTLLIDQVPPEQATEAFGLYALSGRATAFLGPYAIGIVTSLTLSQRLGIIPVIVLLAAGALGLVLVKQAKV